MTTVNASPKSAQLRLTRRSPAYWRVTIDNPPDADLDAFVEALATRIAGFDKWALANTKRLVNTSLPPDVELGAGWDVWMASLGRPAAQGAIKALMERGFHKPGDVEDRLGYHVGQLGR
jgi:hypothetical protein